MSYGTPNTIDANRDPISYEFYEYYRMPRGQHPNSTTGMSATSDLPFMSCPLFAYIEDIFHDQFCLSSVNMPPFTDTKMVTLLQF